ncbi:MAG: hypothetical protein ACI8PZ_000243 [Myxococcota bacterium]
MSRPEAASRGISVSVLEVQDPSVWVELEAVSPLAAHVEASLSPTRRVVRRSFAREVLPVLRRRGVPVLVRFARAETIEPQPRADLSTSLRGLPHAASALLHRVQRRARAGRVLGTTAWDPVGEASSVDGLVRAGLLAALPSDAPPRHGPYLLHPDLPPPPPITYDFTDAVFELPDDLEPEPPCPDALLTAIAALAAGLTAVPVNRTLAGPLAVSALRKLAKRLALPGADRSGRLEDAGALWVRAWALAEGVGLFGLDDVGRWITVEPGLDGFLAGDASARLDRLVRRVLDPDLHPLLPAIQAALRQSGGAALDDVVWLELLCEQHRDVLFSPWGQVGRPGYPASSQDALVPYDDDRFALLEGRLADEALRVCARVGLIRLAPGAFAPTPAGLAWSGGPEPARASVWVTSDLEVIVPPGALTPSDRYSLEQFARCTSRDVVDRFRLERSTLADWLRTDDVAAAIALLEAHAAAVPASATAALRTWARSLARVVLVHGVLLPALPSDTTPEEANP